MEHKYTILNRQWNAERRQEGERKIVEPVVGLVREVGQCLDSGKEGGGDCFCYYFVHGPSFRHYRLFTNKDFSVCVCMTTSVERRWLGVIVDVRLITSLARYDIWCWWPFLIDRHRSANCLFSTVCGVTFPYFLDYPWSCISQYPHVLILQIMSVF